MNNLKPSLKANSSAGPPCFSDNLTFKQREKSTNNSIEVMTFYDKEE